MNTDGSVNGPRGDRNGFNKGGNAFGISTLNLKYTYSKTSLQVGKVMLQTPVTDSTTSRAVGVKLSTLDIPTINANIGFYDSVGLDTVYDSGINPIFFGNNLTMVDIGGKYEWMNFNVAYWNFSKIANGVFGEISAGKDYSFKIQAFYTAMSKNPKYRIENNQSNGEWSSSNNGYWGNYLDGNKNVALNRGVYTLEFSAKPIDEVSLNLGFVGSFGDGYAVGIEPNNISKGGRWWYLNNGMGANGFSLFSTGQNKGANIYSYYLKLDYSPIEDLLLNIDFAGVGGKNYFALFAWLDDNGNQTGCNGTVDGNGKCNINFKTKNATFYEISPSIKYNINKNAHIFAYYSGIFGGVKAHSVSVQGVYKF